jgi:hypothetical protein
MPIVGRLVNIMNPKYIAAIGVIVIAHAHYLMAAQHAGDFDPSSAPRYGQCGHGHGVHPLNLMTLSGIPPMEMVTPLPYSV